MISVWNLNWAKATEVHLKEIWGESVIKDYSGDSSDYKFYNLGNNQYGAKHKDASSIDPLKLSFVFPLSSDCSTFNSLLDIIFSPDQI